MEQSIEPQDGNRTRMQRKEKEPLKVTLGPNDENCRTDYFLNIFDYSNPANWWMEVGCSVDESGNCHTRFRKVTKMP
jgi:hypothetical protein